MPAGLPGRRPAALAVIRSYRRHYLLKWLPGTAISFKAINEMSLELIKEIARAYYPDDDRPELKASLADLVALHNRVGAGWPPGWTPCPCGLLRMWSCGTVVRYHEMYQSLRDHWGYAFIKRHHLDKVARWGWTAINYANPWYWGRKAAYEVGAAGCSWPGSPTWWGKRRCGSMAGGGSKDEAHGS